MTDEIKSVVENFKNKFADVKQKKIALYGLGKHTKEILDLCEDYNIVALLDRTRTGEMQWGLPIVSVDEAYKMGVDRIIIVASSVNTPIIFRRIFNQCEHYHIPVFDMDGRKLVKTSGQYVSDPFYDSCTEANLKELINASDVVSFDIFDTLLVRNVLYPEDIFDIVGEKCKDILPVDFNFPRQRILAERKLYLVGNPKMTVLYEEMSCETGLSREFLQALMETEIAEEKRQLHARKQLLSMAEQAYRSGKKVCCTSDMYLSKDFLKEILAREGYNFLDNIFVSCEYGVSKANGLYSILRREYPDSQILHVGDNKDVDIVAAQRYGIDMVFQIPSVYKMIGDSIASWVLDKEMSLEDRICYGTFFSRAFNNPFLFEKVKGIFAEL